MIFAGFDIETTGLEYASGHKIIEVAVILRDEDGADRGRMVQRYNPGRPIDPKAQAVHGITFEELASCPTIDRDAAKLAALLGKVDAIVAHNGIGFDIPFLNHELLQLGIVPIKTPVVDTMVQARWATPMGKNPNLGELCFACDVPYDKAKAHAAEYDVDVMLECFLRQWKNGYFAIPPRDT